MPADPVERAKLRDEAAKARREDSSAADDDRVTESNPRATHYTVLRTRRSRQFWTSYLRLGLLVTVLEVLGTLGYLLCTPHGMHRGLLIGTCYVVGVLALLSAFLARRIATRTWRKHFSFTWTLLSGVLIMVICSLDGGLDSPLLFLLVLPIVSASLGLSVPAVVETGFATLLETFLIWISRPNLGRTASYAAMFCLALLGLVVLAVGFVRSQARLQAAEERLEDELAELADTDELTECLNHGAFYARLQAEINRALRHGEPLSLLMIDVDQFKGFNDANGHVEGDRALAAIGRILRTTSREFDAVGRVGGDEFAIILPHTSAIEIVPIVERMHAALFRPDGLNLSSSVGGATLDDAEPSTEGLVHSADLMLYEAKAHRRGPVELARMGPLPEQVGASHKTSEPLGGRLRT